MKVRSRKSYQSASGWDVERARFKSLFSRGLEYWLSHLFDMTIRGPGIRRYWIAVLGALFVAGAAILHIIFYYIPILAPVRPFVLSQVPVFIVLTVARLVIILFIPAFIAITLAGNYLADIFELKDPSVAWDYISTLSLGSANYILHIRDGKCRRRAWTRPCC